MSPTFERILDPRRALIAVMCAVALVLAVPPAHADVTVTLTPSTTLVTPGTQFDVTLDIPVVGAPFNGFSIVLSYDPAILTPVPTIPATLQEGCLMTGGCSTACGNTFHQFVSAGDSIVVNDYLFCNQVGITGPGRLYKLRFLVRNTPPTSTQLTVRRVAFYNAGVFVNPVRATGTTVQVPSGLAVGDGIVTHTLRVEPNPAHGRLQLVLEDGGQGMVQADILDLQGRLVRSLGSVNAGARARLDWDGTDRDGKRAPGGLYLARIQRGDKLQTSRFILLR